MKFFNKAYLTLLVPFLLIFNLNVSASVMGEIVGGIFGTIIGETAVFFKEDEEIKISSSTATKTYYRDGFSITGGNKSSRQKVASLYCEKLSSSLYKLDADFWPKELDNFKNFKCIPADYNFNKLSSLNLKLAQSRIYKVEKEQLLEATETFLSDEFDTQCYPGARDISKIIKYNCHEPYMKFGILIKDAEKNSSLIRLRVNDFGQITNAESYKKLFYGIGKILFIDSLPIKPDMQI